MHLLVIEDERALCETIVRSLRRLAYSVDYCYDGEKALALLGVERYDLVLLDLNLPKKDGMTVLRTLRQTDRETRVLILSARSEVEDKVQGLDQGADYYLTKPFEPRELLACVRALARRQPELRNTDMLEFGDLKLEKSAFTLSRGERSVRLSRKEFDMMELLMLNRNLVLTKESLLLKIWGYESDAEDNNVEVYISFLRKKLAHIGANVRIRTIRMVGYCLEVGG